MDTEIQEVTLAKRELTNDEKIQFDSSYATRRKDPTTALLLSLFLGGLGADRFYIGDTGLGIAKLCTLGGLFVWGWIDWFRIKKITREKNLVAIREIHDILIQMRPENGAK